MFSAVRWTLLTNWSRHTALHTAGASGWSTFLGISGDLAPDFAVDVRLDEVVDLGDRGKLSDRLIGEVDRRVDQELLGELDDRPVRPADVLARPTLGPQAGDDLDDEVDLVGEQRDRGPRTARPSTRGGGCRRSTGVQLESRARFSSNLLAEQGLRLGVLGEDALARHLGDIRRLQVDLQVLRESGP